MDEYFDTGLWDPTGIYRAIVPMEQEPSRGPSQPPSYETPWYVDSINRAIERAAQVATIDVGGYPPYPTFPSPSPGSTPGVQPQPSGGVHLSTNTLMLIVGGFLLFSLGKRGR